MSAAPRHNIASNDRVVRIARRTITGARDTPLSGSDQPPVSCAVVSTIATY
ncbi:hypothetical protein [Xanthomonas hortorum]|uniref:hypothetical protein n=1 Tax=Xanthomonas TaxID=338 RepID=UPI0003D33C86|nr:hypothetical protein [Xanthomonas hortorum]ETC90231.1 hypothetical protein XHC_0228 [Xanthomonas hortorum pv. carotae str. M081]MBG3850876.1 hypothetical protein [Xanthomonas hortorum pv. carotae]UTS74117.1 hypothetical protein NMB96_04545 [Xanthomonas hortorum]